MSSIPNPAFQLCLSVALYVEWQQVLVRPENLAPGRTPVDTHNYLRYLLQYSHLQEIYFLWRPNLPDPDDDMIFELAFAAGCNYIVTHNKRDFEGTEQFGIQAIAPRDFLHLVRSRV